ncbi:Exonuclease 1 [Amphibalanus amphitrite]|uniref:Exonuclease 1 n=1 Tax=Amphibalanus amphitrite TaxID=1232801 RepID=A0A6A4WRL3_AMPAM|nr:Exonuclease 1 [Amphibalanus amphitrite]
MGITGLLPFLKKSTRPASVREFSGGTAAVDAYSWLHKGAFACADRLVRGEPTDVYVHYCLKYVNMLLAHGLKPVLVFDGRNLPSKADTEAKRREGRKKYRALAADHLRAGRDREARECFQRCVDVTPAMARELIKACRARGVDCVVAPYEADAQLAFLARNGLADLIITEDSDLVLFGCPLILFKMDAAGNGQLVEAAALPLSLGASADKFSLERLRLACIISGCDYQASLPGVGLGKASKLLVRAAGAADSAAVLAKLASYLGVRSLPVTPEYRAGVLRAEETFLYQLVFDPRARRLVPLTPYPPGRSAADYPFAGAPMDDAAAFQAALGNTDINTGAAVDTWNPDRPGAMPAHAPHKSIWARDFVPSRRSWPSGGGRGGGGVTRPGTAGKVARLSVLETLQKAAAAVVEQKPDEEERRRAETSLMALYAPPPATETESQQSSGYVSGATDAEPALTQPASEEGPAGERDPEPTVVSATGDGAPAADTEQSPEIGQRPGNPFRVRGPLRERLEASAKRRLSAGDAPAKPVTSKYFPAPSPAPAERPQRAPVVQSMEEFLKRRQESAAALERSPKRARLEPSAAGKSAASSPPPALPAIPAPPPARSSADSWYKMSSVFDPKHAMTVWDSEVDGLRAAPAATATPRSPGKENSPEKAAPAAAKRFLGRSPPAAALFGVRPGPSAGRGAPVGTPAAAPCRKVGLAKPPAARQLNLKQMFGYRKPEVAQWKK